MAVKDNFEMPAEYQKYLADYLQLTNDRKRFARELKDAPPAVQKHGYPVLQQLDQAIERIEGELAAEHERIIAEKKREQDIEKLFAAGEESVEKLFIEIRDHKPQLFEEFKALVLENMSGEEEQAFYERIAVREAEMKREKS